MRDAFVRIQEIKLDGPPFYIQSDLAPHGNLLRVFALKGQKEADTALGIVKERNTEIEDKNQQSRKMLGEASRRSHEAAISRLRQATIGYGRTSEALAYLANAMAFDPSNTAAQATAAITLTSRGSAIGPRWPSSSLLSSVPISISPDALTLASVDDTAANAVSTGDIGLFKVEIGDPFVLRVTAMLVSPVTSKCTTSDACFLMIGGVFGKEQMGCCGGFLERKDSEQVYLA